MKTCSAMAMAVALAPLSLARSVNQVSHVNMGRREASNHHGDNGGGGGFLDNSQHFGGGNGNGNGHQFGSGDYSGFTAHSQTEVIIIWANPGNNAQTTPVNEKVTVTETVTASGGTAATQDAAMASHTVVVGGADGLVFNPPSLSDIPVGDTIVFQFQSQNHTVTQSGFDAPCVRLDGGMDTGFQPNPDDSVSPAPEVAMQVMSTDPLWFYCRQEGHCGMGMVFSVNPTAEKTQEKFQSLAIAQNGTGDPSAVNGGGNNNSGNGSGNGGGATNTPPPPASTTLSTPGAGASTPAAGNDSGNVPGQGTVDGSGSCQCVVTCSTGSFPAVNAQGVGAFGGMAGSLPMAMVMGSN